MPYRQVCILPLLQPCSQQKPAAETCGGTCHVAVLVHVAEHGHMPGSDLHAYMHAASATACRPARTQQGWEVATAICVSWYMLM